MILSIISIVVFSLLTIILFCLWVYYDCLSRGIKPFVWVLLIILTTPVFGLILYYILERRKSQVTSANRVNKKIAIAIVISIILLIAASLRLAYLYQI